MTTTSQLIDVVSNFDASKFGVYFGGVHAADNLPPTHELGDAARLAGKQQARVIVNYSDHDDGGTHWCGMGINFRHKRAEWFDSFGFAPDAEDAVFAALEGHPFHTHFYQWLLDAAAEAGGQATKAHVIYSDRRLQDTQSDVCGEWSVWYVLHGLPTVDSKPWAPLLRLPTARARDRLVKKLARVRRRTI